MSLLRQGTSLRVCDTSQSCDHGGRLPILAINCASPARISEGPSSKELQVADLSVLRSEQWVRGCSPTLVPSIRPLLPVLNRSALMPSTGSPPCQLQDTELLDMYVEAWQIHRGSQLQFLHGAPSISRSYLSRIIPIRNGCSGKVKRQGVRLPQPRTIESGYRCGRYPTGSHSILRHSPVPMVFRSRAR